MSADYDNVILFLNIIVINKYFYYRPYRVQSHLTTIKTTTTAVKSLSDVTQAFSIHMTFGIITK